MIITLEDNALIADIKKARREYANGETIFRSMCKFCTYCFFLQLSRLKDIGKMLADGRL